MMMFAARFFGRRRPVADARLCSKTAAGAGEQQFIILVLAILLMSLAPLFAQLIYFAIPGNGNIWLMRLRHYNTPVSGQDWPRP